MSERPAVPRGDGPIILASGSPRRRELLGQVGIRCEVVAPDLPEELFTGESPGHLVRDLARAKADAVRNRTPGAADRWILAADTVVVVDEEVLGKPADRDEAERMIRLLAGRNHTVVTGVAILAPNAAAAEVRAETTTVSFSPMKEEEIAHYLETADWVDVAGAYRIQGRAALYIDGIRGSYSNVVGLPIHLVYSMFTRHGYRDIG